LICSHLHLGPVSGLFPFLSLYMFHICPRTVQHRTHSYNPSSIDHNIDKSLCGSLQIIKLLIMYFFLVTFFHLQIPPGHTLLNQLYGFPLAKEA
jgi:hypothetical protein